MKKQNLTSLKLQRNTVSALNTKKRNSVKGGWVLTRVGQNSCAPIFCDTKINEKFIF